MHTYIQDVFDDAVLKIACLAFIITLTIVMVEYFFNVRLYDLFGESTRRRYTFTYVIVFFLLFFLYCIWACILAFILRE